MTEGERIKKRRKQLGISQEELAKLIGYKSRSSINKIESGQRNLPHSKLKLTADALDTTPNYIIGWKDILRKWDETYNKDGRIQKAQKAAEKIEEIYDEETSMFVCEYVSFEEEERHVLNEIMDAYVHLEQSDRFKFCQKMYRSLLTTLSRKKYIRIREEENSPDF